MVTMPQPPRPKPTSPRPQGPENNRPNGLPQTSLNLGTLWMLLKFNWHTISQQQDIF